MQKYDVIIVGGGYAGTICALRLAGKSKGRLRIALVNPDPQFVERLRLHETLVAASKYPMRSFGFEKLLGERGVRYVQGSVVSLNRDRKTVRVANDGFKDEAIRYERLVIAAGSTSSRDLIEGQAAHSYVLDQRGENGVEQLTQNLAKDAMQDVTVVGGGATGIEVAAEIAQKPGTHVRLIAAGAIGQGMTEGVLKRVRYGLADAGIEVVEHEPVLAIDATHVTLKGRKVPHDVCITAAGFVVAEIWKNSGLETTSNGRIRGDAYLRSMDDTSIYVAGDACHVDAKGSASARMSVMFALTSGAHVANAILDETRGRIPRRFGFWTYGQAIGLGPIAVGFGNMRFDRAYPPYFTGRTGYHLRNFFVSILYKLLMLESRWPGLPFYFGRPIGRDAKLWNQSHRADDG